MKPKGITIKLDGSPEDKGDVRLGDFLEFLGDMLRCLRGVDRFVSRKEKLTTDYKITGLSRGSATVMVEPVPYAKEDHTIEIVETFTEGLVSMQEEGKAPQHFERPLIESFRALAKPLSRRVAKVEIRGAKKKIRITKQLEVNIDAIIGEDITLEGSVGGYLDVINVHDKNAFFIYPVAGPTRVECYFSEELLETVKGGIKRHVNARGTLRYKRNELSPYRVDVENIEIYPPEEQLPTLESLRGVAPEITGEEDSVEFVRRLRSEW